MLLSILLPTYNRVDDITKNLSLLISYMQKLDLKNDIEIIVSDNLSPDNTVDELNKLIKDCDFDIKIHQQTENIGLEKNALFVLEKAIGKYVMYIGDDDFIDINYLKDVVTEIKANNPATVLLSSILGITKDNKIVSVRDVGEKRKRYKKGYLTSALKMYLGNQLSGMTFLREDTLKSYKDNNVNNIYLFVYFIGFNMQRGDFLYITEYPVKVTEGAKKDWGYGYDGLLNDYLKNYKVIFNKNILLRLFGEITVLNYQPGRVLQYFLKGPKVLVIHLYEIFKSENISLLFKIFYIFICILHLAKKTVEKLLRKVIVK